MKADVRAVVIGGGVIGCSILYHLAKAGWSNSVLVERDELTSGSTWHAAANIHGLHDMTNISRIQHYTMNLYKQLEQETGQSCGIFQPGSLYLAQTQQREHQLRLQESKAKLYNMEFYEVSLQEARELHPLLNLEDIRCVMYEPSGGNVDPSGVTNAYAVGARERGAEVYKFTEVIATEQQLDGSWIVKTTKGDIKTQWIINAAGLWGREVARLAGLELPLRPTEHQYLVTEKVPFIENHDRRLPSVADRDGEYYLRQEGNGFLVGAYEKEVKFWAEKSTPLDFGHELFDDDLERIEENILRAIERVPTVGEVGIKRVINGPMIWSPDSNVLFGPAPKVSNYFCCNGVIPGFSQSGGMGMLAAEWITKGETQYDMFAWDLTRFGDWCSDTFTKERVRDQYANRFKIHFPGEEREAGRPLRKRPAFQFQKELGGVFGLNYGWEHPLYFDFDTPDTAGFTRQDWWKSVRREALLLRKNVGIIDISNFGKYLCCGDGAYEFLDGIFANKIPKNVGGSCLSPIIGKMGGIAADATITKLSEDSFWIVSSGAAEGFQQRFYNLVKRGNGTEFISKSEDYCGFNVAGPKSRELLQRLSNRDLSNEAWPFFKSGNLTIAGVECLALRVSFTGDLGWELYCEKHNQLELYKLLIENASQIGGGPVGSRALMSLRLEKGYGSWGREYSPEYWPHEVGLERLIANKPNFINKNEVESVLALPAREQLVVLKLNEADVRKSNADALGGEPIFKNGNGIGRVTSGGYGYSVNMSLALGFVKGIESGEEVDVMVLGKPHKATVLSEPPFDPESSILRS
ncbi:MAG: FAD-dependent oxidoreductase [Paracoccaceae bacterium]|nr:FAD-dependent oxidoreductase [Paracoccaceae bacterium]